MNPTIKAIQTITKATNDTATVHDAIEALKTAHAVPGIAKESRYRLAEARMWCDEYAEGGNEQHLINAAAMAFLALDEQPADIFRRALQDLYSLHIDALGGRGVSMGDRRVWGVNEDIEALHVLVGCASDYTDTAADYVVFHRARLSGVDAESVSEIILRLQSAAMAIGIDVKFPTPPVYVSDKTHGFMNIDRMVPCCDCGTTMNTRHGGRSFSWVTDDGDRRTLGHVCNDCWVSNHLEREALERVEEKVELASGESCSCFADAKYRYCTLPRCEKCVTYEVASGIGVQDETTYQGAREIIAEVIEKWTEKNS